MNHLDLFSGIGGFALAARWMGWETKAFCDSEPYCQKLLKQNFPNIPVYENIKTISRIGNIDIITGGFPCQPFSQAGKQVGKKDNRYLWPEMLRVITQEKPTWVIGENVPGIIGMALDAVHADLEAENYAVQSFIIPAVSVDAQHKRDRVWIIAYTDGDSQPISSIDAETSLLQKALPDTTGKRTQRLRSSGKQKSQAQTQSRLSRCNSERPESAKWKAEPRVGRVVDGFPGRVDRIKGLGNAIVPQVAHQIFKHIERFSNERKITLV